MIPWRPPWNSTTIISPFQDYVISKLAPSLDYGYHLHSRLFYCSVSLSRSLVLRPHTVRTLPTALYIRCLESCLTASRSLRYLFAVTVATLDRTSSYFASSSSRRVYSSFLIFSSSSIISEIETFAYPSLSIAIKSFFSMQIFENNF